MSSIYVNVEACIGASISEKVIPDMVRLAQHLGISVRCNLNGVDVYATRESSIEDLVRGWSEDISKAVK